MGPSSFYFVSLSAVVVAISLLIQCVVELQKYKMHDLAGAIISVGLLREVGPLTVGLAWNAKVAARISEEGLTSSTNGNRLDFARNFILPRYLAALFMSFPLVSYGLVIGFVTAALFAPVLSVSTTNDFLDSAQRAIQNKDIATYFIKLVLVFPFLAVFAGSVSAITGEKSPARVAAQAVTMTFASGFVANLFVTTMMYYKYFPR